MADNTELAISVSQLTYLHNRDSPPSLEDVSIHLPPGSRTILVGANGGQDLFPSLSEQFPDQQLALAGKSTLLQILAGKRLVTSNGADIRVKGRDVFRDSPPGVTFLGTEWSVQLVSRRRRLDAESACRAMNPVVRGDIVVSAFLDSVGGYRHKERRNRLLDILDVDLDWHMHAISDGERRRVQLCMGLMVPWDVLLLDEVSETEQPSSQRFERHI